MNKKKPEPFFEFECISCKGIFKKVDAKTIRFRNGRSYLCTPPLSQERSLSCLPCAEKRIKEYREAPPCDFEINSTSKSKGGL